MVWQRWSVVVGLGLCACNRANPAFGDDDAAADTADTGKPSTSGTTEPPSDTIADGPLDTATSFETTVPGTSGGDMTTSGDPPLDTGMDPSTGEPTCMTVFPDPWGFEANPPLLNDGCTGQVTYPIGIVSVASPTSLVGTFCNGCPCETPGNEFAFSFDVPTPPLPDCFFLHVQYEVDEMGVCAMQAYSMEAANDVVVHVVSNVVNPDVPEPFEFTLTKAPWAECGDNCSPKSGFYGLTSGGVVVEPNGMATPVPGVSGGQFQVIDVASGIDDGCHEVARWHSRIPG